MNDGMLSQDEIDALLNIGLEDTDIMAKPEVDLTSIEKDTIGEIGNISFGSSATTLSTLLNQKVEITTPEILIMNQSEIDAEFDFEHVCVKVHYVEGFSGENIFIIKTEDAAIISDIMLGGDGTHVSTELNEIHLSAIQEAMNQMMGTAATSMSTVFNKKIDISPPNIATKTMEELQESHSLGNTETFVKVSFQLKVGELIDSNIMQVMPVPFAKDMANELLQLSEPDSGEEVDTTEQSKKKPDVLETPVEKEMHIFSNSDEEEPGQFIGKSIDKEAPVQKAVLSEFPRVEINQQAQRNLDMLLDIPLKVTVELGRTKRTVKDILNLTTGSIVELDKLAGEPVDVLVNEKLIAKGEVVVIDENFGVRITDILNQTDRLMNLK